MITRPNMPDRGVEELTGRLLQRADDYLLHPSSRLQAALTALRESTRAFRSGYEIVLDEIGFIPPLSDNVKARRVVSFGYDQPRDDEADKAWERFEVAFLGFLLDKNAYTPEKQRALLSTLITHLSPLQRHRLNHEVFGFLDAVIDRLIDNPAYALVTEGSAGRALIGLMSGLGTSEAAVDLRERAVANLDVEDRYRLQSYALALQHDPRNFHTLFEFSQKLPLHPDILDHDARLNARLIKDSRYRLFHKFRIRKAASSWERMDTRMRENFARKHITWLMRRMGRPDVEVIFTDNVDYAGAHVYTRDWGAAPEGRSPDEKIIINRSTLKHFLSLLSVIYHEAYGHGGQVDYLLRYEDDKSRRTPVGVLMEGSRRYVQPRQSHLLYFVQGYEKQAMLSRVFSDAFLLHIFNPQEMQRMLIGELYDYVTDKRIRETLGEKFCVEQEVRLSGLGMHLSQPDIDKQKASHLSAIVRDVCEDIRKRLYPDSENSEFARREVFFLGRVASMSAAFLEAHVSRGMAPHRFAHRYQHILTADL